MHAGTVRYSRGKAGVSDQTIQVIVQEKVIETAAFSIEDIVEMKQAGVGDTTLQMLIKEGSFLRNSRPIVYGKDTRPIRFTTAGDVIELKQAGLSDEVIQAVLAAEQPQEEALAPEVSALLEEREAARRARDWARADAMRDELARRGYAIEDTPEGPRLRQRAPA